MGKDRAEIQRAYRQRLKEKNNEDYLRRERERMRRNYVPSSELSVSDRKRRNELNREKLRKFYQKKHAQRLRSLQDNKETSGYESAPSEDNERGRLRVRLPFQTNRRKGALFRWRRELSQANSQIRLLEQERANLKTKCKTLQRSLQRKKKRSSNSFNESRSKECTPSKQTEQQMKEANLNPIQKESIRRTLLLGNVLLGEVRSTRKETPKGSMKALHRVVAGAILRKYKCATILSEKTGLCRHRLAKTDSKRHQVKRVGRISKVKRNQEKVEDFMKREDNSKLQPGKADVKKVNKNEKKQIYILTDYLSNLYKKFKSENLEINLSFTSFCRARPKYILLTAFSSRSSCLCTKHQNAALSVKMLRREGVEIPANPEKAKETLPSTDDLKQTLPEELSWSQWKRVEVEEKGKKKFVTKIIETKMEQEAFVNAFQDQMDDFDAHVKRVAKQYQEIKSLKEKLPAHEMLVQLDFAENYSCRSMEEVQSAYFNQSSVTLHPVVAYFRSPEEEMLMHRSFVIVSDEMGHKASTVIAFINDIIPALKDIDNDLKVIHYWSDSPTSQYRNKHIFDLVSNHEEQYGIKARWNYFEAGHGKGPCDGIGGSCKRLAYEAMRSGKAVIQDATDFYDWARKSNMTNVNFRFVSAQQCKVVEKQLEKRPVKPVKGTMKIHAVVGVGNCKIKTKETSCYCAVCIEGQTCEPWKTDRTRGNVANTSDMNVSENITEVETVECDSSNSLKNSANGEVVGQTNQFDIGDFVAAIYDDQWYLGKIKDKDDEEFEVCFMEFRKHLFQWPRREDALWIREDAILTKIQPPEASGKTGRMLKLIESEKDTILKLFSARK